MGTEWGNEEIIHKGFIVEPVTPLDGSSSGDSDNFVCRMHFRVFL